MVFASVAASAADKASESAGGTFLRRRRPLRQPMLSTTTTYTSCVACCMLVVLQKLRQQQLLLVEEQPFRPPAYFVPPIHPTACMPATKRWRARRQREQTVRRFDSEFGAWIGSRPAGGRP